MKLPLFSLLNNTRDGAPARGVSFGWQNGLTVAVAVRDTPTDGRRLWRLIRGRQRGKSIQFVSPRFLVGIGWKARPPLGAVRILKPDTGDDGRPQERKRQLQAITECDRCGKEIELWAETMAWTGSADGATWIHDEYGPATGSCCGLMYCDDWYGLQVFDLRAASGPEPKKRA